MYCQIFKNVKLSGKKVVKIIYACYSPDRSGIICGFLVKKHKNIAYSGTIFKLKKVCVLLKKLF